jgi:hypothetical protein
VPRLPGLSAMPPPLPPGPDGRLTVTLPCSTSPDMSCATPHEIVLEPDWTMATPHDLEAERVAAALGGYLSCLHLVEHVVPAVRQTLQMHARRAVPRLKRAVRGTWRAVPSAAQECCRAEPSASVAAAHLRGIEHTATCAGGDPSLASTLLQHLLVVHAAAGSFALDTDDAELMRRCVSGANGPGEVWEAGLHPCVVAAIHDEVVGADGPPLPEALYLGVVARRPDLAWLADTVAAAAKAVGAPLTRYDTPHLAQWLAWTETPLDKKHRQVRTAWLTTGASHVQIEQLSTAGYSPADAAAVAQGTGRSLTGVVVLLAEWLDAGCKPSADDLLDLYGSGIPPWQAPSKRLVARLRSVVGGLAEHYTTTELGLMLLREGTVPAAAALIRAQAGPMRRGECA